VDAHGDSAPRPRAPRGTLLARLKSCPACIDGLDRVALLEQIGERHEAGQIRLSATTAYSGAWNDSGRHRLVVLVGRADRILSNRDRPLGWTLRLRSAPAR
jgi:hypothetical protein